MRVQGSDWPFARKSLNGIKGGFGLNRSFIKEPHFIFQCLSRHWCMNRERTIPMKKRIIIIDDEPLIPALIKEFLDEKDGYEISEVATTPESFLNSVKQNPFDVALIDISIREREGGIELLRVLK